MKKGPGQQQTINQAQYQEKHSSKKKMRTCRRNRADNSNDTSSKRREEKVEEVVQSHCKERMSNEPTFKGFDVP